MNEVKRCDVAADDDLAIGQRRVEDEDVHIDCLDTDEYSPLARAVLNGQDDAVQRLLGLGSDASIDEQTLLAAAIQRGHDAVARLLYPKLYPGPVSEAAADAIVLQHDAFTGSSTVAVTKGTYKGKDVLVKRPRFLRRWAVRDVRNELEAMRSCASPYLMQLLAVLDNDSTEPLNALSKTLISPVMIVEYMDQGDLHEYIQMKKYDAPVAMSVSTTDVALVVARALADLHGNGINHRDVRSHNIFLSTKHYIRLGHVGSPHHTRDDDMMTSGVMTKYWTAPEVLRAGYGAEGLAYTTASDIYSLGVVLTELDNLQEPYDGVEERWSFHEKVRTGQLRPHMSDTCPQWLDDLVNQCLSFDPAERPTAADIVEALILHRDATAEDNDIVDVMVSAEPSSTHMALVASAQRLHAAGLEMCLYMAATSGDQDDVDDLLQYGVDPGCRESFLCRTPLHSASLRGDVTMVARLLAAGANVNAIDAKACSSLHLAALHGHLESGVTAAAVARERGYLVLAKRLDDANANAAP